MWLFDEGWAVEEVAKQIEANIGIATSAAAVSGMCKRHAFAWKIEQAKEAANDKATSLPADFDAKKKAALAQREFEKVFNELSTQEIIALQRLDLDRQIAKTNAEIELEKLKLARVKAEQKDRDFALEKAKFKRTTCELFVKWYADKRAQEIMTSGASQSEMIEALGRAMFPDDWGKEAL